MKLDYLEHQLFVPEIIAIEGMSGVNGDYLGSNGRYYLTKKGNDHKSKRNLHAGDHMVEPIVYTKNGGYTVQFNQRDSIWHLRSAYYGLIAYAVPKSFTKGYDNGQQHGFGNHSNEKQLVHFMDDHCVWNVYQQHGVKESLVTDYNVKLTSVQLADNMSHWKIGAETDTEEINGEFEPVHQYENHVEQYDEGVKNQGFNHRGHHEQQPSWYEIVFGDDLAPPMKRKKARVE